MKKIIELLAIYFSAGEKYNNWENDLEKFKKINSDFQNIYLQLKAYFNIYIANYAIDLSDVYLTEAYSYVFIYILPILKNNNVDEAFKTIEKRFIKSLNEKENSHMSTDWWINNELMAETFRTNLIELIEKDIYEIKIDIVEKEQKQNVIDEYQMAIDLYRDEHYSKAFQQARDVFQRHFEKEFNSSIQHFKKKDDNLSQAINTLLISISEIRNVFAKHEGFENLQTFEQRAICKLAIEQLISIQNFETIMIEK